MTSHVSHEELRAVERGLRDREVAYIEAWIDRHDRCVEEGYDRDDAVRFANSRLDPSDETRPLVLGVSILDGTQTL